MTNTDKNILEKICSLSESGAGLIIRSEAGKPSILFLYGNLNPVSRNLTSLINLITGDKGISNSALINSSVFGAFNEEYGFSSVFVEKYFEAAADSFYLILFSKKKLRASKTLRTLLSEQIGILRDESAAALARKASGLSSAILTITDAPILITNQDCSFISANKSLAKLLGMKPAHVNYKFFSSAKFTDAAGNILKIENMPFYLAVSQNKNISEFKLKLEREDSTEVWFNVSSFITREHSGQTALVLSFFRNVTKEAEVEQIIKDTLMNIPTVLYSTNATGSEYNFISESVRTVFGFSPDEIYANKIHLLRTIYPENFRDFKNFISQLKLGEEAVVEYRMRDRFGKERWVRHSGIPIIRNKSIVRIVGLIQEITEEKKVNLRLERSEERFRSLIDTAEDLIFILDGFGYFSMVNKNGASALGYTPAEMVGRHLLEFIHKEDELEISESIKQILNTQRIVTFEVNLLDRFDKPVTFEISSKPLINNGQVSGMLSIGRNTSNRKIDEHKIRELNVRLTEANRIISIERERNRSKLVLLDELNKLKGEFISNVSHELRTPLASIVGFAETIISDPELPKEMVNEFSNIILMEGRRLAKLINDVLDFSKLDSGEDDLQKSDFEIKSAIDEVTENFEPLISDKNLIVTKDYPKEDIILRADKERIGKVVANLLSNAIKFTSPGGRITVIVLDLGNEVELSLSDTGIGIPECDLPGLFHKFSKIQRTGAQIGGVGFGLVTVKQIIDLHKGLIKVISQLSKGTSFIIRLPKI